MTTRPRPASTYRLQFSARFTFSDATRVVPYLAQLGITDCYVSPLLKAASGSTHGYDICDPNSLNPELGADREFGVLAETLRGRDMGLLLDFVPNHMGLDAAANLWWHDVLEHGRSSLYADYFDIDWEPIAPELKNRLLLPILQNPYGEILEQGQLTLTLRDGRPQLLYGETLLPIEPKSSLLVLGMEAVPDSGGGNWVAYRSILARLATLPDTSSDDPSDRRARQAISQQAWTELRALIESAQDVRAFVASAVARLNGAPGRPESFDALHALLERQIYRLAHWKTAFDEINYRRFFDINHLGALRMEDPRVFAAVHTKVLQLIADGLVTGMRLDHPDGLFDPGSYFEQLQQAIAEVRPEGAPFYLVAEKILGDGESLPAQWPIAGTTGYGFLNIVNRLFVDADNAPAFVKLYGRLSRRHHTFAEVAYRCKRLVMDSSMASELAVLARALKTIAARDRRTRDFTLTALRRTILEVVACFPVYRTYITESGFSAADRETIDLAVDRARRRNPVLAPALFLFLRNILLAQEDTRTDDFIARRRWAMKFQQFCAPIQAKGIEDTGYYRYNLLVSLNEVGGNPSRFGGSPEEFHESNRVRADKWPLELLASATHDTKRGEDARARLNVLSEMPQPWRHHLRLWRKTNTIHRTAVDREQAPDRNDEYLFYQAVVASWPADALNAPSVPPCADFVARVHAYMQKAIKEAKTHTSWVNQNTAYQDAVTRFVESTLKGPGGQAFRASLQPFIARVAAIGMLNSLAQLVLKLASPGVADFYQGTEVWQLDFADPDNRRPVDFSGRSKMLDALMPWIQRVEAKVGVVCNGRDARIDRFVRTLLTNWTDARIKMFVTACGLRARSRESALFTESQYLPLPVRGQESTRIVAFARLLPHKALVAAVPRLVAGLSNNPDAPFDLSWTDTRIELPSQLAAASLVDVFTGARLSPTHSGEGPQISASALFEGCPVALSIASL